MFFDLNVPVLRSSVEKEKNALLLQLFDCEFALQKLPLLYRTTVTVQGQHTAMAMKSTAAVAAVAVLLLLLCCAVLLLL